MALVSNERSLALQKSKSSVNVDEMLATAAKEKWQNYEELDADTERNTGAAAESKDLNDLGGQELHFSQQSDSIEQEAEAAFDLA